MYCAAIRRVVLLKKKASGVKYPVCLSFPPLFPPRTGRSSKSREPSKGNSIDKDSYDELYLRSEVFKKMADDK
jgi:hypothetical protein